MTYCVRVHQSHHRQVLTWLDLCQRCVIADIDLGNGFRQMHIDGPPDAIDALCTATDLADVQIAVTVIDDDPSPGDAY